MVYDPRIVAILLMAVVATIVIIKVAYRDTPPGSRKLILKGWGMWIEVGVGVLAGAAILLVWAAVVLVV